MKQILVIHGGTSFSTYEAYLSYLNQKQINYDKLLNPRRWKDNIVDELTDAEVLYASMPNHANAVYDEWVIYFEKIIPYLTRDSQIVGHSLGAMFLAKYLHNNPLLQPIHRIMLVSGGYNDETYEDLGSFKVESASRVLESANEIHLFHSKDDPVVPFTELAKFQADIPTAFVHTFESRGHFIDATFPELVEILKQK